MKPGCGGIPGSMEQYRFSTTPPFQCPFGGPDSAWLVAEVGEGGDLAALLRRAVATPDYVLIFAVVPPSATATYSEAGFQLVGIPSKKMCGGLTMFVMQHGTRLKAGQRRL